MKNTKVNMTAILYVRLISFFCIFTFCKIELSQATEISPLVGLGQENFSFEVQEFNPAKDTLKFQPNIASVVRLGLNAYGFGVGLSFRGSETDPAKVKTKFTDLQLGYNALDWGIDGFYQTYKGFYISNTDTPQNYPELQFRHYGFSARYALTKSEFSVNALLDQSDPINHSAHKFYVVGGVSHHKMETDTSLLQLGNSGVDPGLENMRELDSLNYKMGVGFGKYWVSDNKFFVGGLLDLLASLGTYKYVSTTGDSEANKSSTSYNIKLAFGYAGSKYRSGVGFAGDLTTLKTPGNGQLLPSANRFFIYFRAVYDF